MHAVNSCTTASFNIDLFNVLMQLCLIYGLFIKSCGPNKSKQRSAWPLHSFGDANKSPGVSQSAGLLYRGDEGLHCVSRTPGAHARANAAASALITVSDMLMNLK